MAGIVRKTLGVSPRENANVEAEKNETVLTNMSRGLNNIVEMYDIGGKKHSQGGTPLNLPTDDKGSGASFIFSDKLAITNPEVLKMFNSTKKKATYADLSKKHVSIINDSKKILIDETSDDLSKQSAQSNIETSMGYLNKLKILQESEKGFPTGLPNGSEEYFRSTGIDPMALLQPSEEMGQVAQVAEQKAYGGIVRKRSLFQAKNGVDLSQFGEADGGKAKQQYIYIQNVLSKQPGFKEALWEEYNKIAKDPDYYGKGYQNVLGSEKDFSKIAFKTPEELFAAYMDMQGRNLMFQSKGYDVAATEHNPKDNKYISEWAAKNGAPLPTKMDDIVKEQISYRAFVNLVGNQKNYADKLGDVMQPFEDIQFGANDDKFRGEASDITLADGAYTNTSAGQVSRFNPAKVKTKTSDKTLPFEKKEDPATTDVTGTKSETNVNTKNLENPLGYRSQDIRNLNRAIESKNSLRRYQPFAVNPDIQGIDAAYYSPERAIAAINESARSAQDVSKAFGDNQSATAAAMAISGNAMAAISDTIGNYADRNVALYNNVAQANSEIATKRSLMDAQTRTSLYNDNVEMDEKFRRGLEMAKDKIVMMKNTAETNMADRYNANLLTEQFKVDPTTGLTYFTNGKVLQVDENAAPVSNKSLSQEFNDFRNGLSPDISSDLAYKLYVAEKTGKVVKD